VVSSKSKAAGWLRVLLRSHNRGPVLCAALAMAMVVGLIYCWQRWGYSVTRSSDYVVTPERVSVTPQPPWIHSNVRAEVFRAAGLERLDLRDRKLVDQFATAFALHPWIARVERVEKRHPAHVSVELQYRRPVAVVEVAASGQPGLLFIDEQSVLLPSVDFAPSQAKDYLRIAAGIETPAGVYGTPWGSERIAGAARLAALWGNRWQPLGLHRIVAVQIAGGDLIYELRTPRDVRIVWGSASNSASSREPPAEHKIAALEQLVADKGPLDREGGPSLIDLRNP
jgi:hypothetical protein